MFSFRLLIITALTALPAMTGFAGKTNPAPLSTVNPVYPAELMDAGKEGKAVVQVTITETGDVADVVVVSAEDPAFGEAAVTAVKQWKFKPATLDGAPQPATVRFPLIFNLPADRKFNLLMGRDVFTEIKETVVSDQKLAQPLKMAVPPIGFWPKGLAGDPSKEQVRVKLVVGPDGKTFNPEIAGKPLKELMIPSLAAASKMTFEPPTYDGKPVYVATEVMVVFIAEGPPPINR